MKLLFTILDGAGDVKIEKLGNKTPLEFAKTKNMDYIAENGKTGILYPIREGVAPESDQSALSLLGFNPFKYYTGRGPIEAFGAGIRFNEGNIVLRGNFAHIKGEIIEETSVKISEEENKDLCALLNKKINSKEVKFYPTKGYRFVLILKNKFSDRIQNTHPGYRIIEKHVTSATKERVGSRIKTCKPLDKRKESKDTARFVNGIIKETHNILKKENLKANYILLRGAGSKLPGIKKLKGKWAIFADTPVDIGIGKLTGMKILEKPPGNKELSEKVVQAFKRYNNLFVQIKSPDKFAHRRDFRGKTKALEKIDREFFGNLEFENLKIVLTADHSTSSLLGTHTSDPVPFAITSKNHDSIKEFNEEKCKNGVLGKIKGTQVMKIIKGEK